MRSFKASTEKMLKLVNMITSIDDWIECQRCNHKYRPSGIEKNGVCKICNQRCRDAEDRLVQVLSPRALAEHTEERFVQMPENITAYNLAMNFDPYFNSLFLWGDCGVGKSHLSSLIVREAIATGVRSVIVTEPSPMLREINAALFDSVAAEQKAINRYAYSSLLVIDDLGTEKVTDYKLEKLYEVINNRDKAMLKGLVITSNFSLSQISDRFRDDRITSRLAGMCISQKVGGQDWRLLKNKQGA